MLSLFISRLNKTPRQHLRGVLFGNTALFSLDKPPAN